MTPEEKNIKEAAFKYLRRRIISKGGVWNEELQDVENETLSGKQYVLDKISWEQPRLVGFSTTEQSVKEYWQKGMYSEEEVKKIVLMSMQEAHDRHEFPHEYYEEWFEQNKKKQ